MINNSGDYLIYTVSLAGAILSVKSRKLTFIAGVTGFIVAILIYKGSGWVGLSMLATFFIAGSFFTGWRSEKTQQIGIAEQNKGKRTAGQVIANGGMAAILGAIAWYKPGQSEVLRLMMAGSLASAIADTLSSELGSVYGRRFYDILTFKQVNAGPDGVVSLEGTVIGIGGATLIALVYALGFGFNYLIMVIIASGAIGNFTDSILGAVLERRNLIGNNLVNFLNTATGAFMCWLIYEMI